MRLRRIKPQQPRTVYHCLSRTVGNAFLLDDPARQQFRSLMWSLSRFCGLQILDHSVMSNHFHIVCVVQLGIVSDGEILERVKAYYGADSPKARLYEQAFAAGQGQLPEELRRAMTRRMNDISVFFQELKQGFSRWFNREHERVGTLWAERFKSLLVEPTGQAMLTVAGYIDLNAVRAGLVSDPKDFQFCGYAQALAGHEQARAGIAACVGVEDPEEALAIYREYLLVRAAVSPHSGKRALDPAVARELLGHGKRSAGELLMCKVRYFQDGVAMGSSEWVEGVFEAERSQFGKHRTRGARPMRGGDWGGLCVLRDLRVRVFG